MGLDDREYARKHRMDPGPPERPPKPRFWIIVISLALITLFILATWPWH